MKLRRRIEQLERQAGIRAELQQQVRGANMSDEDLRFVLCHGWLPEELDGWAERKVVRQYTEDALCVTIILEKVDEPEPSTIVEPAY